MIWSATLYVDPFTVECRLYNADNAESATFYCRVAFAIVHRFC